MITTTLNATRSHKPCADGWRKLLASLGKTGADDEPLTLLTVLDSNGIDDTIWCLRALGPEHHGWMRHYAVDCVERVAHLLTDERSREALRVARRYADGLATDAELAAAYANAAAAVYSAGAAGAAYAAAYANAANAANAAYAAVYSAGAAGAAKFGERKWQADRLRYYLNGGAK